MHGMRWLSFAAESTLLACDAAAVITLRLMKLSLLDARALAEAWLMIEEKLEAATILQARALTGQLGSGPHEVASASLAHVRRKVAANRTRLSRSGAGPRRKPQG